MSIYADFLEFKRGILDCVRSDLASLQRMVRHQGKEVALTNREFQLLQFLLDHPHRYSTTSQILG